MSTLLPASHALRRLLAAAVLLPLALSGLELHTEHGLGAFPTEGEQAFVHDCAPDAPIHLETAQVEEHHACPACLARYRSTGLRAQVRTAASSLEGSDPHSLRPPRAPESAPRTLTAPRGPPLA